MNSSYQRRVFARGRACTRRPWGRWSLRLALAEKPETKPSCGFRWVFLQLLVLVAAIHIQELSAQPAITASGQGGVVVVDRFEFQYGLAHPALPALTELAALKVHLVQTDGVWHV